MNSVMVKNIITIVLLAILIIACLFAIRNANDVPTVKIKILDQDNFQKTKIEKEIETEKQEEINNTIEETEKIEEKEVPIKIENIVDLPSETTGGNFFRKLSLQMKF